MESVAISPKYQVVIPKNIRKAYNLRPGERMIMISYEGRIEMVPERDIRSMRGFLKGMNPEFTRDKQDRI